MSQSKFAYVLFCILIGLEVTKVEICALRHVAVLHFSGAIDPIRDSDSDSDSEKKL